MNQTMTAILFLLPAASMGCDAGICGFRGAGTSTGMEISEEGVLLRGVLATPGPADLAATDDEGVVVGVVDGEIEEHPEGSFFRSTGADVWFEEVVSENGDVQLVLYGEGGEISLEPQLNLYVCIGEIGRNRGRRYIVNEEATYYYGGPSNCESWPARL